ncbi:tetratricopeptide repeat protein [Geobacter anodireducens]
MKKTLAIAAILTGFASASFAADCKDGIAAFTVNNFEKAVSILEPLANQGDSCAQFQLGNMYRMGYGVEQDKVKALKYLKAAAEQGDGQAKVFVAQLEKELGR